METDQAAAAYCAEHEGAQATGACGRCGTYVCPLCLDPGSAFADLCAACREREGAVLMAWERPGGGRLRRWGRTWRDVILSPTATFERTRPGSWTAPLLFTALNVAAVALVMALVAGCLFTTVLGLGALAGGVDGIPRIGSTTSLEMLAMGVALIVLGPLAYAALALVAHVVFAGVFHLTTRVLGGQGGFWQSSWAIGYLSVGFWAAPPLAFLSRIPVVGRGGALLGWLLVGVWASLHLSTVARHHHRLEGGRAALAGWTPFLVVVGLLVGLSLAGFATPLISALRDVS